MNKKEEIDSFLAQSMNELSVQEREASYEELHAIVRDENPETPERVKEWLRALDTHLNFIKAGSMYEVAEAMNRSYVSRKSFRMMFLRADRYDAERAAHRMLKFMEIKSSLFGAEKLVQKITLGDLDEDDIGCIKSGSVQVPPAVDIAGRPLLIGIPFLRQYKSIESEMRARYYIIMTLVESEEVQKTGAIGIWYAVTPSNDIGPATDTKYGRNSGLLWNLPIHWAAAHFCCDSFFAYVLSSAGIYLMPKKQRARLRVHYGDHSQCHNALTTFGIPREGMPLNDKAEASLNSHQIWFAARKEKEATQVMRKAHNGGQSPAIDGVRLSDVLFGRGKGVQEHEGNVYLRKIIAQKQDAYDKASNTERTEIALRVVKQVQHVGGRFLKHCADEWIEATNKEARVKVSMAFRSHRKTKRL